MSDNKWTTDISGAVPVPAPKKNRDNAVSTAHLAAFSKRYYNGGDGSWNRLRLFTVCVVASFLLAVAAIIVSSIAFAELPAKQQTTTTTTTTTTETTTLLTSMVTGTPTAPPPAPIPALQNFGPAVVNHHVASGGSAFVHKHGEPIVLLDFLCNINFANGTCRSVFNYRFSDADLPADVTIFAQAGTSMNSVTPGGDVGQLQEFSPVYGTAQFGGASFLWDCGTHEAAVWRLRSGPAGSFSAARAPATDIACPAVPV